MPDDGIATLLMRVARRTSWTAERRVAARTNVGVSTRELGAALGVTHAAVANWEKGRYNPQKWEQEDAYFDALEKLEALRDDRV